MHLACFSQLRDFRSQYFSQLTDTVPVPKKEHCNEMENCKDIIWLKSLSYLINILYFLSEKFCYIIVQVISHLKATAN